MQLVLRNLVSVNACANTTDSSTDAFQFAFPLKDKIYLSMWFLKVDQRFCLFFQHKKIDAWFCIVLISDYDFWLVILCVHTMLFYLIMTKKSLIF